MTKFTVILIVISCLLASASESWDVSEECSCQEWNNASCAKVKCSGSVSKNGDSCFSSSSFVYPENAPIKRISELKIGDRVLVDKNKYDTVYAFLHREVNTTARFLRICTSDFKCLKVSPDHLLFSENKTPIFAKDVKKDTVLLSLDGPQQVSHVTSFKSVGMFAPATYSGTIVVDEFIVSNYAKTTFQKLAHLSFTPLRLYARMFGNTDSQDGSHIYAKLLHYVRYFREPAKAKSFDFSYELSPSPSYIKEKNYTIKNLDYDPNDPTTPEGQQNQQNNNARSDDEHRVILSVLTKQRRVFPFFFR